MSPEEGLCFVVLGCDGAAGWQRIQRSPVIPPAGCSPWVKDGDRAAVGLGAGGSAEALPQPFAAFQARSRSECSCAGQVSP